MFITSINFRRHLVKFELDSKSNHIHKQYCGHHMVSLCIFEQHIYFLLECIYIKKSIYKQ
jgi:hypothetical protein